MEYPFIFGTAGHIDHGKTALVRAMTGVDCDRLQEEKRRGITIELGFAPLRLPGGKTVSIVDVPGHERFIRQMAAGAAGMDAAILVIAATEGVMPQTREHLDILNLLGVRFGLVALTKKDLADGETMELAAGEAAELTAGSCLDGAPIVPVSSVTGEGIPLLLEEIEKIVGKIPPRTGTGAFFLPVDRVFSKKGFGTVVTGTCYQGGVSEGDEVDILPAGGTGRVRSLQTHGAKTPSVSAGQRAAVNLAALSLQQLGRGDVLCAKGAFVATFRIDAWLDVLPSSAGPLTHWQRVRLHAGTADVVARVALLKLEGGDRKAGIPPGHGGPVQLLPETGIVVAAGQRFVIRFYSPLVTIGGGRIMLPNAEVPRGKSDREAKARIVEDLAACFTGEALLAAIVRDKGLLDAAGLAALSQMERAAFNDSLAALSGDPGKYGLLEFGAARNFISLDAFDKVTRTVLRLLRGFHTKYPELAGLDGEKLAAALDDVCGAGRLRGGDFKELAGLLADRNVIAAVPVRGKTCYRAADFSRTPDSRLIEIAARVKREAADAGFNLLKPQELGVRLGVPYPDIKRALAYLREGEEVWIIEGELLITREVRDRLVETLSSIEAAEAGGITVAALRDAAGVNRKLSLAMLDFLDLQGLTRRDGDKRIMRD
jgi:selenocysteine-specific elongation factor